MKPHVDLSTGKIYGCKKNSFAWFHEKGHIVFNSEDRSSWLLMLKSYIFDFWMLFVTSAIIYKPLFSFAVCSWSAYFFIGLYEEWWCNQYAKVKIKEVKNGMVKETV